MCIRDRYKSNSKLEKMEHQNWGYTTFSGVKKGDLKSTEKAVAKAVAEGKEVETLQKGHTNKNTNLEAKKVAEIMNTDDQYKVETVSHDFRIALQQARQAKNLKQSDLAVKINEKASVIQLYESGKAVPDPSVISKLERVLGVRLPRQKPKKKKEESKNDD
eukprot:TRINITY_DN1405_c0_g1_i6.p1 TRINITY_DN1405_c0_g1~~TRINITY_DN1405_c0_g1_i6.p1  ORF type:complete len:161 (-),score=41.90 TRINITY_DN1405_c0_g1_i6:123-605(-)